MENIDFTFNENAFHIEGFPDAVKVLKITGPKSKRLADLALHRDDLSFALECLKTINCMPENPHILRSVLWETAIVRFIKCFGQSEARFSLDPKVIYNSDAALSAYRFFVSLRNKHIIHDENSYTQCIPSAALNKDGMSHKIAKIICLHVSGVTLDQDNYNNLHLLVADAEKWVVGQFDKLCDIIASELEAKSYVDLFAMEGIDYAAPAADDVHNSRNPK